MRGRYALRSVGAGLLAVLFIVLALVPRASNAADAAAAVEAVAEEAGTEATGTAEAEAACAKVRNVLIVGAGISGVAAARHIAVTDGKCFKVTVLEARNRVGGRMWSRTVPAPGGRGGVIRAEMGARWIHSAKGNPIFDLAKRFKLKISQQNGKEIQYAADGRPYTDAEVRVGEAKYESALKRALQIVDAQNADVSIEKAFQGAGGFLDPYIQSKLAWEFEYEYSGEISDISGRYYKEAHFTGPDLVVTNGYDKIPKLLMKEATNAGAQLVLNFEVTAVTKLASGAVQITGKDTVTGATRSYIANVAILTLPLGVLKAAAVTFSPALSARKRGAISRVGFGNVNKVFFFFNDTFWPNWADEYFMEDAELPVNRGKWQDWLNLKRVWRMTGLEGVAVGAYAKRMTKMTQMECVTDAANKIKKMFPRYKTAKAHTLWLQRWNLDPYARGAYSYGRVGMQGSRNRTTDFHKLAEPEHGNVLFGGEHTHARMRANVHGGYLAGLREARRVLSSF